ncbi:helix-turn-helix transcriptional regulator [Asaia siamensis]
MIESPNRKISEAARRNRETKRLWRKEYAARLRERLAQVESGEDLDLDRDTSLKIDQSYSGTSPREDLGSAIARLRKAQGATQQDLAEALNVSQSTITDWERGKTRPRRRVGDKLARILGDEIRLYLTDINKFSIAEDHIITKNGNEDTADFLSLSNIDRFSLFVFRLDFEIRKRVSVFQPADLAIAAFRIWSTVCSPDSRIRPANIEGELIERIADELDWWERTMKAQGADGHDGEG